MADTSNRGLKNASEETKSRVAHDGGEARKEQGANYSEMGKKGGEATQRSGHGHVLTREEQIEGGSHSGGNFANDSDRAREAAEERDDR